MAAAANDEKESNRQMSTLLKTIDTLTDAGYHKFKSQFDRGAYLYGWHDSVLDFAVAPPGARSAEHDKYKLDSKIAHLMFLTRTDGHAVADILELGELGDARTAFKQLNEFFYKSTPAGRGKATSNFYSTTMSNSSTNITGYIALIRRRAIIATQCGHTVDDETQLTQLMTGLLKEFEPIKTILENRPGETLIKSRATLLDYAEANNLSTLSKGNQGGRGRDNVFSVNDTRPTAFERFPPGKAGDPCRQWAKYRCKFDNCKYSHAGPGGKLGSARPTTAEVNTASTTQANTASTTEINAASCNYCNSEGSHKRSQCPKLQYDKSQGKSKASAFITHGTDSHEEVHSFSMNDVTGANRMSAAGHAGTMSDDANNSGGTTIDVTLCPSPPTIIGLLLAVAALCWTNSLSFLTGAPDADMRSARTQRDVVTGSLPFAGQSLSVSWAIALALILSVCAVGVAASETDCSHTCDVHINEASYKNKDDRAQYEWCSDSGTNRFVTNNLDDFVQGSVKSVQTNVNVGGGRITSKFVGTVRVRSLDHGKGTGHIIECNDVLYIPTCGKKLMPASNFVRKGCTLKFSDLDKVHLTDKHNAPILSGKEDGGLYFFHCETEYQHTTKHDDIKTIQSSAVFFGLPAGHNSTPASADFAKKLLESHWAFGHLNFTKLRKLLGLKKGDDPSCPACTIANARKKAASKNAYSRSTRVNHRIHVDVGFTRNCDYKFQLYIDDYTRKGHLDVLTSKAEVLPRFADHCTLVENDHQPWKVAIIRTDAEPIYNSPAWSKFCTDKGLIKETSGRYRQDGNGVVEKGMQGIGGPFRAMMIQGNSPESNIPECLKFANVVRNNSPSKANNGWTPNDKEAGVRRPVNKRLLRGPMYCLVFAYVYPQERAKHEPRGIPCVYLGYDDVNNVYLVKEWTTGRKYWTADLEFHPSVFPYVANPDRSLPQLNQYNELAPYLTEPSLEVSEWVPRASVRQREYLRSGDYNVADIPDIDVAPESNLIDFDSYFVHEYGADPINMTEALQMHDADQWILAELAEMNSFKHHDVFELVPRSEATHNHKRIFKGKEVMKRKFHPPTPENPRGSLDKHKYRLTIKAFTRMLKQGIDYKEKHANTVRWNAIKIQIAIAVMFDLEICLIDICTFFLYGVLGKGDQMYMEQPPRWVDPKKPAADWIWKLKKSMYGLPQAPHCAQNILNETLTKNNEFKATAADDCVFVATDPATGPGSIGAHVDDLTCVGTPAMIAKVKRVLGKKFKFTSTPNPTMITGVQIQRNRKHKWLKLHQEDYITDLITKHNMQDSIPTDTPMDPVTAKTLMLLPTDSATPESIRLFQCFVGALMWIMKCRPDMLFTVNLLARFLQAATPRHLELALGRPLKYLNGTRGHGLVFSPGTLEWKLSGASDADLAGDLMTARSTSGRYTKIGEFGAVSADSKLERKVSTSTGQSETYAFQSLAKEVIWQRLILSELGYPQLAPTPIYTDNDGVVTQSTKAVNHAAAKHYRIAQAFIRQLDHDKIIKAMPIDTSDNGADLFTKALAAKPFIKHRHEIMDPQGCPI